MCILGQHLHLKNNRLSILIYHICISLLFHNDTIKYMSFSARFIYLCCVEFVSIKNHMLTSTSLELKDSMLWTHENSILYVGKSSEHRVLNVGLIS